MMPMPIDPLPVSKPSGIAIVTTPAREDPGGAIPVPARPVSD